MRSRRRSAPASTSSPPTRRCSPSTASTLAKLAEENGVALNFEAAVAGGIPVIKTLRESLAANEVTRVYGILNGTCNYILTTMADQHRSFAEALKEAQELGYAEADPTFDIGGFDTAHKLAILTSLAFGTELGFDQIDVEGIQSISEVDIEAAQDMGYRIKLLGVATRTEGGIEARVHPAMVPEDIGDRRSVGVPPTASPSTPTSAAACCSSAPAPAAAPRPRPSPATSSTSPAARVMPPFVTPTRNLKPYKKAKLGAHQGAYYVRLSVFDRPGAMAAIAKRMGDREVSIESIVQRRPRSALPGIGARQKPGTPALVIMITHETTEEAHSRRRSKPSSRTARSPSVRR